MTGLLLLTLAASESGQEARPLGIRDLRDAWDAKLEEITGFRAMANLTVTPLDGSASYETRAQIDLWLRAEEGQATPVVRWSETRPEGITDTITIVTLVTPTEVTYVYQEDRIAYVYPIDRESQLNIPFQYYFVTGPSRDFGQFFRIEILGTPHTGDEPPPEEQPGGAEANAAEAAVSGRDTLETYVDLSAEDAWVMAFDARDDDLAQELEEWSVWLGKENLLPYRMSVASPIERVWIVFEPWAPVQRYDPAVFELDLEAEGYEIRRPE